MATRTTLLLDPVYLNRCLKDNIAANDGSEFWSVCISSSNTGKAQRSSYISNSQQKSSPGILKNSTSFLTPKPYCSLSYRALMENGPDFQWYSSKEVKGGILIYAV